MGNGKVDQPPLGSDWLPPAAATPITTGRHAIQDESPADGAQEAAPASWPRPLKLLFWLGLGLLLTSLPLLGAIYFLAILVCILCCIAIIIRSA